MNLPDTRAMSPEDYDDLLARQDWRELSRRLTEFAHQKIYKTSWADAEDLAQSAIRHVFDASCQRWNPATQPDLFLFLANIVPGLLANLRRAKRRHVEIPYRHAQLDALAPEAIDATDAVLGRRQRARLIVEELERRVAGNRAASAVLAAFKEWIDDPRDQAAASGLSMQAVYNARTMLRALAAEIAQTFDQGTVQ